MGTENEHYYDIGSGRETTLHLVNNIMSEKQFE